MGPYHQPSQGQATLANLYPRIQISYLQPIMTHNAIDSQTTHWHAFPTISYLVVYLLREMPHQPPEHYQIGIMNPHNTLTIFLLYDSIRFDYSQSTNPTRRNLAENIFSQNP